MKRTISNIGLACLAASLVAFAGGCRTTTTTTTTQTERVAGEPTAASNEVMAKLKALEGTWEMKDETGKMQVASVIRVSSAGSVVCETMFPGMPHEMTNMYHLDGDGVIATHYCAMGNQPRMRCTGVTGNTLAFAPLDCTNLQTPGQSHMAQLSLVMVDANHLRQEWVSRENGKDTDHANFDLTRR